MAVRGRNKILKDYTFQKMIERTLDVYNHVLGKKTVDLRIFISNSIK